MLVRFCTLQPYGKKISSLRFSYILFLVKHSKTNAFCRYFVESFHKHTQDDVEGWMVYGRKEIEQKSWFSMFSAKKAITATHALTVR